MTRLQKALTYLYVLLYAAGLYVLYMDVYVWRAEEPKPSGAQIQAAQQAKAYFK
jgi:threonine/homoserine/homoserine lactone efflux protein